MTIRQVAPPATLPVTLAEAKTHLRVTHDEDDALIMGLLRAALAYVERDTGRAFESQTWELTIDRFPTSEIMIPMGPLVSVTSVIYTDADGLAQTVPSLDYEVDTVSETGWVSPSVAWPAPMATINAVRVTFVVGLGTPEDIRQAILLILGLWYDNRAAASDVAMQEIPFASLCLIKLHRHIYI